MDALEKIITKIENGERLSKEGGLELLRADDILSIALPARAEKRKKTGPHVFFNVNCVILDVSYVTIGSNVLFAPNVQVYSATHPTDWRIRAQWVENAKPISIGSDVWIGGSAIILPGVSIGDKTVIGAGSIVTKDIPSNVLAVGNPCGVIKELN